MSSLGHQTSLHFGSTQKLIILPELEVLKRFTNGTMKKKKKISPKSMHLEVEIGAKGHIKQYLATSLNKPKCNGKSNSKSTTKRKPG